MGIEVIVLVVGAALTHQAAREECADEKPGALRTCDSADPGAIQQSMLTVRVYDFAGLPGGVIRHLEQRTGEIMFRIGIRLEWV
jgi:hypothetical protein